MKVISLKAFRDLKNKTVDAAIYGIELRKMDKAQLLQELLNYHDTFQQKKADIGATVKAQQLMEVLEERAELKELQELSKEFRVKLKARLYQQIQEQATIRS